MNRLVVNKKFSDFSNPLSEVYEKRNPPLLPLFVEWLHASKY